MVVKRSAACFKTYLGSESLVNFGPIAVAVTSGPSLFHRRARVVAGRVCGNDVFNDFLEVVRRRFFHVEWNDIGHSFRKREFCLTVFCAGGGFK